MNLSSSLSIYLKTTETCNLNCSHCFTSGSQGKKIFFDPQKVIRFFTKLKIEYPHVNSIRYMFHGGEPFLAPVDSMYQAYEGLKNIFPNTRFGMQTNLVFKLTDQKRKFLKDILLEDGFGTSWDYDIRFGSQKKGDEALRSRQIELWENNVRTLISEDEHYLTMIVSITAKLIEEKEPIEIIEYARDLGFKNILFERITSDGNAKKNNDVIPSNRDQDDWLYRMFTQSLENETYKYIGNMLLSELVEGYLNSNHVGNRCRVCEQSLLTINADGSIAGCPNTGPVSYWGHIDWEIKESIESKKRQKVIACEKFERNPLCFSCPAFAYCNSDCHQLSWDEGESYCAAPKKIWNKMITEKETELYQKLLLSNSDKFST